MFEPLPDFHNSDGRALVEASRRRSYFVDDGESMGSFKLLHLARDSLARLLESSAAARELGLESYMKTVLGERSVDVERTLLDRSEREALEATISDFIARLSPFCDREDTGYILEYLCSRYEAMAFCADKILMAVAPFHINSPRLVQAARGAGAACPASWKFVAEMDGVSRATLARRCIHDDLAEILLQIALSIVDLMAPVTDDVSRELLLQPHFQLAAGTLVRAFEITRGRDDITRNILRRVLPGLSHMLSHRTSSGLRMAAYCITMSIAANASTSSETRCALAEDALQGIAMPVETAARGLICLALLLNGLFDADLDSKLVAKIREIPESLLWLERRRAASGESFSLALKLLLPRLALRIVEASDDGLDELLDIICSAAPELAWSTLMLQQSADFDEITRRRIRLLAAASLKRDPQCFNLMEIPEWLYQGPERPPEIVAARILSQQGATLQVTPEEAAHPMVRSALEYQAIEHKAQQARALLAYTDGTWAFKLVEEASSSTDLSAALKALAPHVTKLQDLEPIFLHTNQIDDVSSLDFLRAPPELKELASAHFNGTSIPLSLSLATELYTVKSSALLKTLLGCLALSTLDAPVSTALAPRVAALIESEDDFVALDACLRVADASLCSRDVLLAILGTNYISEGDEQNLLKLPASVLKFFGRASASEDPVAYALVSEPGHALRRMVNKGDEGVPSKYVSTLIMAAGDNDGNTRKLAIAALRLCQTESATASLALALAADVAADADALAASVRACLDDAHLELLRESLTELSTPTQQRLAAKLLSNVYDKGGNHSALVAAWRRPVTNSTEDIRSVLGSTLARLLRKDQDEAETSSKERRIIKRIRETSKEQSNTSSMSEEAEYILVALLKSRFAASEDGTQLSLDGDAALAALTALSSSSNLSVAVQEIALDALARRVKHSNDDEATAPLFAAVLGTLRAQRVSRTKALAAVRGLDASEIVFARAWAGALKRRPKDFRGLTGDCSALLDAMVATRERPGRNFGTLCCKSMLAALTRLAPVEDERASHTRCQLLYEVAAVELSGTLNGKHKMSVTDTDLALVLEISEKPLEKDAAMAAIGTLFQLAPKLVVLAHWQGAVKKIRAYSCLDHNVKSTVAMTLVAVLEANVRLADFLRIAISSTMVEPLARAIDLTSAFPHGPGVALVALFALPSDESISIESMLARDDKQLEALTVLCRAVRCALAQREFIPSTKLLKCQASDIVASDLADSAPRLRRCLADLCRLIAKCLGSLHGQRRTVVSIVDADRRKLALCHELALCHSGSPGTSQDDVDDENGMNIQASVNRALRRGYRLLESPQAFVALSQHLLDSDIRVLRDTAIAALHEGLASARLFVNEEKEDEDSETILTSATPLAKLILMELLPYLSSALIPASCDEGDASRAVSAARAADVLARQMASRAPGPFSAIVEVAATAACLAARAGVQHRTRAALGLLSTLFATMRHRALPILAKALPRALDALRSAVASTFGKVDAAEALLVLVASVPKYLHTYLHDILELLVLLEEESGDEAIESKVDTKHFLWIVPDDDTIDTDLVFNEARMIARRAARALATGVEPRILLPAWYAAFGRAREHKHNARPAAVLCLMAAAVDTLGRRAARSHAAKLGAFSLQALLFGRLADDSRLECRAIDLIMRLLLKLTESELVEWLRAAAKWGLSGDSEQRSAFLLLATTVAARLKEIAAKHVANVALTPAIDVIRTVSASLSVSSLGKKKKKQKLIRSALDLLCCRAVACVRSVMQYGGSTVLDTDRFDSAHPALTDLILLVEKETLPAIVQDLLPSCLAFLAAAAGPSDSEAIHRALNARLMLHARDAPLPARLAALAATKAIITAIGSDVAYFANQMVQAIAECLEDPRTSIPARDIVLLVDRLAGVRII